MGSFCVKAKKRLDGSYYWRVIETIRKDGEKTDRQIPISEFPRLGFTEKMTVEQARKRVKSLNALSKDLTTERKREEEARISAAGRVARVKRVKSVLIPDDLANEFENEVMGRKVGSTANNKRLISHWNMVQRIIADLRIEPHQYANRSVEESFYNWCIDEEYSYSSVIKYRHMLNMWGRFMAKRQRIFFEELPSPNNLYKTQIEETYEDSDDYRGASEPLTVQDLKNLQRKFKDLPGQWNYLYICVWLGLRPSECDWLKRGEYEIYRDKETGCDVIKIYQAKLVRVRKKDRWKLIPCFLPEQEKALEIIKSGDFKRPLTKTLKSYLENERVTLYGPRKNFYSMMLNDYGRTNEEVSAWMGHRSVVSGDQPNQKAPRQNTLAWTKYRDQSRVVWQKPAKTTKKRV